MTTPCARPSLSAVVSGALWCVLGAAGLLGGVSGALVERYGLR
ncbi:MFS transporter, partial [Blastococcus sp. KM273128]|nr:MFS transporter [Blastococcus sp. KM273128]